ncbi:MAG: DUF342 domain-containing protein [Gammaproteobacteria bacterium]|nr:DUF342 domain-containing protein [Gammaproteobacteria bacterium]
MDNTTNEDLYVSPDRFGLNFALAGDNTSLSVSFAPGPAATPLELPMMRKLIDSLGYSHLPLWQDKLNEVVHKQRANNEAFTLQISGNRDGALDITLTKDRLNALAIVRNASGNGQPLTRDSILAQLKAQGVTHGVQEDVVAEVVEDQGKTLVDELVIAQGKAPVDGKDTRFVSLVEDISERRQPILDNDTVDYREFGGVNTVSPGDRVLRRVPPTEGEDGYTVTGEPIAAKPGKDKELKTNKSVQPDPQDPDVLIANVGGMPVITERGAFVEQLINLDSVDLKSGNIEFDGTVIVKGDVKSGMKVKASGDINVMGTVDAAKLEAEGSITVNGGIIGHGAVRDEKGKIRMDAGYVSAKGNVMARFYKNVYVEAGDSVIARDTISHSEVASRNQVVVGGRGGSAKASIVGGKTRALMLVQAPIIGSPASAHTTIDIGFDPDAEQRSEEIEAKIAEAEKTLADVDKMANFYKVNPDKAKPGLIDRIVATQMKLIDDLVVLKDERKLIEESADCVSKARLIVTNMIYANVTLNFGKVNRITNEDLEKGTFMLQDTWIAYRKGVISRK